MRALATEPPARALTAASPVRNGAFLTTTSVSADHRTVPFHEQRRRQARYTCRHRRLGPERGCARLDLRLQLLPALLAGLLVFEMVKLLTPWLRMRALGRDGPRLLAVALIATVVVAVLVGAGLGLAAFLRNSGESLQILMQRMAQIVEDARAQLPAGLLAYVPEDAETLQRTMVEWLRTHSSVLQLAGRDLGRTLVHVLMGMIIGALLSLQRVARYADLRPLAERVTAASRTPGLRVPTRGLRAVLDLVRSTRS